MRWRWAAASEVGTSHARTGSKLQDAHAVLDLGTGHLFAAVADGAGSASFGGHGAWLACRCLKTRFREWLAENEGTPDDGTLRDWVDDLRDRIAIFAERRDSERRQFAATLAALLVSSNEILALHVGDSAVVGRRGSGWETICRPENGEYASSTYFITDEPEPRLNILRTPRGHDAFALFTDGVGDLALTHPGHQAHPKFFDPMIKPVDAASSIGRLPDLSARLRAFLAGPSVCERTDDDKTLVLISGA